MCGWFSCLPIADQVEAHEQPQAPNVSNEGMAGHELTAARHQIVAHITGVLLEAFCLNNVQDCQGDGTGDWVTTELKNTHGPVYRLISYHSKTD